MPQIKSKIWERNDLFSHHSFSDPLLSTSLAASPSPFFSSSHQKDPSHDSHSHPSQSGNKMSPAVLFVIIILAVIFFISGVLHLLVRYLMKKRSDSSTSDSNTHREFSSSGALQRQLQQLFHLHDSGLDQTFIDALPVFLYKDIKGLEEPFDCAVCLCEFSQDDKLRLLPLCSHAFHLDCIDTWLLSNSTCPLCRGMLFSPELSIENPIFEFDDSRDEDSALSVNLSTDVSYDSKPTESSAISRDKRVFSVRLGKFRSTNISGETGDREVGETSNSNLDARRCYSMGSFQYVVANSELQVALCPNGAGNLGNLDDGIMKVRSGQSWNSTNHGDADGKKIHSGSKGESFSISKIWLWSKKDKLASSIEARMSSSSDVSLPWLKHGP